MLENNGFYGKTMGFGGKQCFLKKECNVFTRLNTWSIFIIKHMNFIKIKTTGIHVLHKSSFHNTIPHRSHRTLIGHVAHVILERTLINSPLFCTSSLWKNFFLVVENHCVFLAHIFWNCAFFPRNVREKRKTQTKNYHCMLVILCRKYHVTLIFVYITIKKEFTAVWIY